MWDSVFDSSSAAGYFTAPNQFDSPAPGKGAKGGVRRLQNVLPVCIRQLRDHKEEEFKLFNVPAQILCLVGILKEFEVQSTKATYEIEDHTGRISAVWWLESDVNSTPNLPAVKEGCYVKIFGSLKNQDDKKTIMILRMFPVDNINEVTTHLLEVVLARLDAETVGSVESLAKIKANNPGAELANSMAFMNNDVDMSLHSSGFTSVQAKVFNILKPVKTPQGISRAAILKNFPPNQHREVNEALEFLVNEGHAYSTVDDDHFMVTDSL